MAEFTFGSSNENQIDPTTQNTPVMVTVIEMLWPTKNSLKLRCFKALQACEIFFTALPSA